MKYDSGTEVKLGDRVRLWKGKLGRVACDLDRKEFSSGFEEKDWGHLSSGILIEADSGDVFHYEIADEDLELVRRKS